jgi:hypothetical protein
MNLFITGRMTFLPFILPLRLRAAIDFLFLRVLCAAPQFGCYGPRAMEQRSLIQKPLFVGGDESRPDIEDSAMG